MASGSFSGNGGLILRPLCSVDALLYTELVFKSLRSKLLRLGSRPDIFGIGAELDGLPAGAIVGELTATGRVRLVSLFVLKQFRGRGLGVALLLEAENMARQLSGAVALELSYLAHRPATAAVEGALRSAGWNEPVDNMLFCKASTDLESWPLYLGHQGESPAFQLFPWIELTDEDAAWIERTQRESPWIPEDLYPLKFRKEELEPITSLGIRHQGRPVGWVLSHRLAPDTVHYTTSFIDRRYQRGLHILPAYREAAHRQIAAGIPNISWMVPWEHRSMADWVLKRWPRELIAVNQSRICLKPLAPSFHQAATCEETMLVS